MIAASRAAAGGLAPLAALVTLLAACGSNPARPPAPAYPAVAPPPGPESALRADLRWRAVEIRFHREAVLDAEAVLSQPSLRIFLPADATGTPAGAPGPAGAPVDHRVFRLGELPEQLRQMVAVDVDRVAVRAGELVLVDAGRGPRPVLWLHRLELALENAATRARLMQGLPTLLTVRARVGRTGLLTAFVTADPFAGPLEFAGRAAIRDLDMRELSPLVADAVGLRTPRGRLDLFVLFESRGGRLRGAVKPMLRGVDVAPVGQGLFGWLKANSVDLLAQLLSRDREGPDVLATVIPIEGQLSEPRLQLWPAVFGVLYHAFVAGMTAGYAGLPPERAPEPASPLAQGWRVLIQQERPRAQPTVASTPPRLEPHRGGIPIGWEPSALMRPGGRRLLERRLRERGLMPVAEGEVAEAQAVSEALLRFQAQRGLPETGLPGYATMEALGLEPAQIFGGGGRTRQMSAAELAR